MCSTLPLLRKILKQCSKRSKIAFLTHRTKSYSRVITGKALAFQTDGDIILLLSQLFHSSRAGRKRSACIGLQTLQQEGSHLFRIPVAFRRIFAKRKSKHGCHSKQSTIGSVFLSLIGRHQNFDCVVLSRNQSCYTVPGIWIQLPVAAVENSYMMMVPSHVWQQDPVVALCVNDLQEIPWLPIQSMLAMNWGNTSFL